MVCSLPSLAHLAVPGSWRCVEPLLTILIPTAPKKLKIYPPPASACTKTKDPVGTVIASQLEVLDPSGERATLFSRKNPEGAKVGDILRVTFKNGDPFAGVCLNIRSRGLDTAFLIRNQLTKVGCEMWIKVHSPNVKGVEVVQRTPKRKRRARLYYMRYVLFRTSDILLNCG